MKQPDARELTIECHGVRCTEDNLCEVDDGRIMVSIPRQDIRRIVLRYGIQAPHPVLQIVIGVALIGLGYFPIRHLIYWMQNGGVILSAEGLVLPLAVLGLWLISTALKRGCYLHVWLANGSQRLALQGRPEPDEVKEFLAAVERCYGIAAAQE